MLDLLPRRNGKSVLAAGVALYLLFADDEPGLCALDELRTAALQAQRVPAREASFRQLYLNQWGVAAAERWLPLASWDACV